MRTILLIICLVTFVLILVYLIIQKFAHIDMTQMRFNVTYWPYLVLMFAAGIAGFGLLSSKK